LAAWIAWLWRMSGQQGVLLGVGDGAGGVFALDVEPEAGWTLRDLLAHVDDRTQQARARGALDEDARRRLQRELRGDTAEPLFRATFEWPEKGEPTAAAATGVVADIAIAFAGVDQAPTGRIEFAAALFSREAVERLAANWRVMLQDLLAAPQTAID